MTGLVRPLKGNNRKIMTRKETMRGNSNALKGETAAQELIQMRVDEERKASYVSQATTEQLTVSEWIQRHCDRVCAPAAPGRTLTQAFPVPIQMRVDAERKSRYVLHAKRAGLNLSAWIKRCCDNESTLARGESEPRVLQSRGNATAQIQMRVTADLKDNYAAHAEQAGLRLSEWILDLCDAACNAAEKEATYAPVAGSRLTAQIQLRTTTERKERYIHQAENEGLKLSQWIQKHCDAVVNQAA